MLDFMDIGFAPFGHFPGVFFIILIGYDNEGYYKINSQLYEDFDQQGKHPLINTLSHVFLMLKDYAILLATGLC